MRFNSHVRRPPGFGEVPLASRPGKVQELVPRFQSQRRRGRRERISQGMGTNAVRLLGSSKFLFCTVLSRDKCDADSYLESLIHFESHEKASQR